MRDHVSTDVSGEIDKLHVYVKRSADAKQGFHCSLSVFSPITETTLAGDTASFSGVGVHTLALGPLDYVGSAADVVYSLFCQVPAQRAILGYYWEEDLGTDGEGE